MQSQIQRNTLKISCQSELVWTDLAQWMRRYDWFAFTHSILHDRLQKKVQSLQDWSCCKSTQSLEILIQKVNLDDFLKRKFSTKKSWICNGAHGGILHPLFFCRMCEITSFAVQDVTKSQCPLVQKLWNIWKVGKLNPILVLYGPLSQQFKISCVRPSETSESGKQKDNFSLTHRFERQERMHWWWWAMSFQPFLRLGLGSPSHCQG